MINIGGIIFASHRKRWFGVFIVVVACPREKKGRLCASGWGPEWSRRELSTMESCLLAKATWRIGSPVADLWAGRAPSAFVTFSAHLDWSGVLRSKVIALTPTEVVEAAHA